MFLIRPLLTGSVMLEYSRGCLLNIMEIMDKIIEAHGRSGVKTYNQLRFSLTLIGPVFITLGIFGLVGIGEILSNGIDVKGIAREISYAIFLAIGIISLILRLSLFNKKRYLEKSST